MGLLGSLGLDKVEADPNYLPEARYAAEVFKDEYLFHKSKGSAEKDTISHVITYRVTEGDRKGVSKAEFFEIGKNPEYDEAGALVGLTPTMSEQQKPWYKKRLLDLGLTEQEIDDHEPGDLVGKSITMGIKKNGEYTNISFIELREGSTDESTEGFNVL